MPCFVVDFLSNPQHKAVRHNKKDLPQIFCVVEFVEICLNHPVPISKVKKDSEKSV